LTGGPPPQKWPRQRVQDAIANRGKSAGEEFYQQLLVRRKAKLAALIAVARKLLAILNAIPGQKILDTCPNHGLTILSEPHLGRSQTRD